MEEASDRNEIVDYDAVGEPIYKTADAAARAMGGIAAIRLLGTPFYCAIDGEGLMASRHAIRPVLQRTATSATLIGYQKVV